MKYNDNNVSEQRGHTFLKRAIGIASAVIFAALMVWVTLFVGRPLINELFGSGGTDVRLFSDIVSARPIRARLIYIGIQILQVFVALIPGEAVEIAGGLAFGAIEGMVLSLIGVAIGSSIIFLLTKTAGIRFVELFVSRDKIDSMRFIRRDSDLNTLVFLVFFIPGTPKDALTYLVALTRMRLPTFLMISLIARIPSVLSSTWGGSAVMDGDYRRAVLIFAVTAVVSAIGLMIYRSIAKKRSAGQGGSVPRK